MKKVIDIIDKSNDYLGRGASYIIVPLLLIVLYEVFMRYVLNRPTLWAFELTTFLYGAHFMLGAGHVHLLQEHVGIDVVEQRFPDRVRTYIRIISFWLIFVPFVGTLFISSIEFAYRSWSILECTWTAWAPPIYPVKTLIPISMFFLLLQGFSNFLKDLNALRRK